MCEITARTRWRSGTVAFVGLVAVIVATVSCTSVPPQVAKTHQKEMEILQSLQKSHLAMVDAYVDQKMQTFETFYFQEFGPAFRAHWVKSFKETMGRDFDQERDFPLLYSDLVASYQIESAPIEAIRGKLHSAIRTEYQNAFMAHKAVGGWLDSLEKLNAAQRQAVDGLLGSIKPGLSLDSIEVAVADAKRKVEAKIKELTSS